MSARKRGKEYLAELEQNIRQQGVKLSYEKLQFGGLRLKSGLCWFKGKYYLFVDRYKPPAERIDLLEQALDELATLPDPAHGPPAEEDAPPETGEAVAEDQAAEANEPEPGEPNEPEAAEAEEPPAEGEAAPEKRDA
ncbi:MAG: hypothetical protein KQH53_12185 [Desulfarculaceae bacterium]|nr:hypothetical protein [Desulfarculaceae bacterium]